MKLDEYEKVENIRKIPVDLCVPNEWNANKMDENEFKRLVEEIDDTGFLNPIQVVPLTDGKFRIIGGEHRWHACKVLEYTTVPAVILTEEKFDDKDLQKFVSMRQNIIHGKINAEKFAKLFTEMTERYSKEALQKLFGFTDKEVWNRITSGVEDALKDTPVGKDGARKFRESVKDLSTVDGLGGIITKIFNEHGDTLTNNFVSFSFGGKNGLFVVCENPDAYKAVSDILDKCKDDGLKADNALASILKNWRKDEFWGAK